MIAGIILAAGASSRMGSPKALLDYRGETFVERLVNLLSRVCDPVIVALGHHAAAIRARVERSAQMVINPDPDRGQLSSLQAALAAIPAEAEGFLFIPVDCPAVELATVRRVAAAFESRKPETLLVIPRIGDKRGHPVFAVRSLAEELLALPPTGQARDVVHGHRAQTEYVNVDDPGILTDVDDLEAYRKLMRSAS